MKNFLFLLFPCLFLTCIEEGDVSPDSLGQWSYLTKKDGMVSDVVTALYTDSKGNVWIGTTNGLSKYDGNSFTNYTKEDGSLTDNWILSIVEDHDHFILVGTKNGMDFLDGDEWDHVQSFEGIEINALAVESDGVIWVATSGYGVIEIAVSGQLFQYIDNSCFECNWVNALFSDSNGMVWIGSNGDLKSYNGKFQSYTVEDGLASPWVSHIASDHWGNLWVGGFASRQITKFRAAEDFESIPLVDQTTFHWVRAIVEDRNNLLWLATDGGGLVYYDGAIMRKVFDLLDDEYISSLTLDNNGDLWVGSEGKGIAIHRPDPN